MKQMIQKITRFGLHLFLLTGLLAGFMAQSGTQTAYAATQSVGTCDEASLNAAIAAASPGDTITFSCSGTITLSQTLQITKELTIDGAGQSVAISGGNSVRGVIRVDPGPLTLKALTITNGYGSNIDNYGLLTLNDVTVANTIWNGGQYSGGGIYNYPYSGNALLTITNSTISGNGGGGIVAISVNVSVTNSVVTNNPYGEGIYNRYGNLTVTNSTISGNGKRGIYKQGEYLTVTNSTISGNLNGGIYVSSGNMTLANSTISGNSSDAGGGLAFVASTIRITNATISGNQASYAGGGIFWNGGNISMANTIIANSTAGGDCYTTNSNPMATNVNNLVEDGSCSPALSGDPLLGSLANNGGPTMTLALLAGSPAINAGDNTSATNAGLTTDQRGTGFARIVGGTVDLGAFEYKEPCPAGTYDNGTACVNADPGYFVATAGATSQTPCPPGFYQPNAGSTSCIPAEPGYYVDTTAAIAQIACPVGYTSEAGATACTPLDTTPPVANPTYSQLPNSAGWYNSPVTVTWNWTDEAGGSGIDYDNCTTSTTFSSEGYSGMGVTCKDKAGNMGVASFYTAMDTTAPTLNPVVSPNPVVLNGTATVTSNAADALSGLKSESCGALDTSTIGTKSVTCTATDNAGNTSSASASYSVIADSVVFNFSGFLQPVDNLPALNLVKAGQGIPVKFSLNGNQGLNILASGSPASVQIACDGSAPVDLIETVTSGNSGLSYDAATDTYTYVWKTAKSWAGTCRQFKLTLTDGSTHMANFKFK